MTTMKIDRSKIAILLVFGAALAPLLLAIYATFDPITERSLSNDVLDQLRGKSDLVNTWIVPHPCSQLTENKGMYVGCSDCLWDESSFIEC